MDEESKAWREYVIQDFVACRERMDWLQSSCFSLVTVFLLQVAEKKSLLSLEVSHRRSWLLQRSDACVLLFRMFLGSITGFKLNRHIEQV